MMKQRLGAGKEAVQPNVYQVWEVAELAPRPMWVSLKPRTSLTSQNVWFSTENIFCSCS